MHVCVTHAPPHPHAPHRLGSQVTKAEQKHKAKLAEMSCMICERIHGQHEGGNVELHHLRTGGWGKGDFTTLIPLCFSHHMGSEGIHTLGTKAWERRFDVSQRDLLELVRERVK